MRSAEVVLDLSALIAKLATLPRVLIKGYDKEALRQNKMTMPSSDANIDRG